MGVGCVWKASTVPSLVMFKEILTAVTSFALYGGLRGKYDLLGGFYTWTRWLCTVVRERSYVTYGEVFTALSLGSVLFIMKSMWCMQKVCYSFELCLSTVVMKGMWLWRRFIIIMIFFLFTIAKGNMTCVHIIVPYTITIMADHAMWTVVSPVGIVSETMVTEIK